jgi:DTW domain-containing protein YfiP
MAMVPWRPQKGYGERCMADPLQRRNAPEMAGRALCPACWRPQVVCYCSHVQLLSTRTRVLILQHPRESRVGINTARIARMCLQNSDLRQGVDFSTDPVVCAELSAQDRPAVLLFPGDDTIDPVQHPPEGAVTLVVLDGTWWQASKLLKSNPSLRQLPRYGLSPEHPSRYRIRGEPEEHCVATIEALAEMLGVLEGDRARMQQLLLPFDAMVEHQLAYVRRGVTGYNRPKCRPGPRSVLAPELQQRPEAMVLATGEVNAWPLHEPDRPVPEVVHWVAVRPATGDRFEALLRPQTRLCPTFCWHAGIEPEQLAAGESFEHFAHRWAQFSRAGDVVCMWGHFAGDMLEQGGVQLGQRADLRLAAIRQLRRRAGPIEACAVALGAHASGPWAAGRAGARMAQLEAIAQALLRGR